MTHLRFLPRVACLLAGLCAGAALAQVQPNEAPGPVGGVPATLPEIRLPGAQDLRVAVPRPVRAAQAALGLGRQRLALVLSQGMVGSRLVVDSAPRDAQAVATALRSGGFVVMQREDLGGADLRSLLKEFRDRLQPGSVGFIYATGLGVQVDGRNLLLPRDATLDANLAPAALAQQLRQQGVALDELTDALIGTVDSPRLLVVDAAYKHPALAGLPQAGLAEPRLPNGTMALFGHALGSVQEVPAVAPLPLPPPTEPTELAATPFARTLVSTLLKARISGPEALRTTRRVIVDATLGQSSPWLGGDTDGNEDFAEATLLDGLIPRTPEDVAREALRQSTRLGSRPAAARAGEQSVAEVLQQGSNTALAPPAAAPDERARPLPEQPGTATSLASTVGNAAGVLGTVAGAAATVAAVTATVRAAEAAAVAQVATTAVGTAASVVGNAVALAARSGSSDAPARETVRQAATGVATSPSVPAAVAPAAAAAPAAASPTVAAAAPTIADPATAAAGAGNNAAQRVAQAVLSNAVTSAQPQNDSAGPRASDGRTERTSNGGERPVYTPRTNPFGYAEGDTFTYEVTDVWKGEVTGRYTTAIEEVLGDGKLLANGQQLQLDAQGRITRQLRPDGGLSQFEPAQALWWAKPTAGERRVVKYIEKFRRPGHGAGETEWTGSARVGKLRKIETPAGEFEVLPVESSGWWTEVLANGTRSSGQWSRTAYYSPKLGHPVAIDIEDADRVGKLLRREKVQLMHAQTARSAP